MNMKKSFSIMIIFLLLFSGMISLFDNNWFNNIKLEDSSTHIDNSALSWLPATQISDSGSSDDSSDPDIAVDNTGSVHIVWEDDSEDHDFDIYYKKWDASTGTFSAITDISSTSSASTNPAISADNKGNIHVVWMQSDILYRMWNKSTDSWEAIEVVGPSYCYNPDIAVDIYGNIHVVWYKNYDIYYNYLDATTGLWGSPIIIYNESNSINPRIATDYLGNLHVTWLVYYDEILYMMKNATTGLWSDYELISTDSSSSTYFPSIAVDGLGNVHIAWHDNTNINGAGTDYDIFYRMYNITTSVWSGQENSTDTISDRGASYGSYEPDIGVDNSGNVYVVWSEFEYYSSYSDYDMVQRMYNMTTKSWEPIQLIYGGNYDDSQMPSIAVDTGGNSHVVWQEYDYDDEIFFSKSIASPPMTPILNPITPNPNPNLDNHLVWTRPMEPAQFYVYRNSSYINSVEGLTPIAVLSTNSYDDVVTDNGTYYYAIITENEVGNSSLSNCEGVNVSAISGFHRLRIAQNADFAKYEFSGNGTETNPWIIEDWYIDAYGGNGMYISDTTDYFIAQNNTIYDGDIGIYLNNVTNGRIINNTARFNRIGINLTNSNDNILINNTIHNSTNPSGYVIGIGLSNSDNNWFEDNNIYGSDGGAVYGGVGFWFYGSESNTLFNNHIHHNFGAGVIFQQSSHFNNLTENEINNNTGSGSISYHDMGIVFFNGGGRDNYLIKNDIHGHLQCGIYSSHTGVPNFFYNNTIHDNSVGMDMVVSSATGWQFNYNKFYNNAQAGDLWLGSASFYKNEVWNNTNGLSFWGAGGTTLRNNTFWNNSGYALAAGANDMKLYDNLAYDNGNGIYCQDWRVIAEGNQAYNNSDIGFTVYYDSQFTGNIAIGNGIGVKMYGGGHQTVDSNTILDNGIGIHCINDVNATITNNDILNNSEYGIYCQYSNHTTITWNIILNGTVGIYLENNLNTTVQYNEVYNFTQMGIKIENTNESLISWNLLFNNSAPLQEINGFNNTIGINPSELGPELDPIIPPEVDDGAVHLQWESLPWATYYQVFRSWVFNIDEFWDIIWATPILNITTNEALDTQFTNLGSYHYVVVAANKTTWSTISNTESVNITGLYGIPGIPTLNPILPNPDYNYNISLDWNDVENATDYYIYRHTSEITDITGLTPIAKVSDSNYSDSVLTDGDYYYVIVGANDEHNGSISNCENVTIEIAPQPETPVLDVIVPRINYRGVIDLNWSEAENSSFYFVYRDTSLITDVSTLTPIANITATNYIDTVFSNDIYYYVIVSGNIGFNSSISNCENVTVEIYYSVGDAFLDSISPPISSDGIIELTWSEAENATWYYIYKDTKYNSSITALTPISTTINTNYTDYAPINGTFYYAIIGGNLGYNGSVTNSESVSVEIPARADTGWTIPSILSSQESIADSKNSSTEPKMLMDEKGNLFIVWADMYPLLGSGDDTDIFCRIYNESKRTWGSIITVSTESDANSTNPAIALDAFGNFYVAWADLSDLNGAGHDADIFYKMYNATTKFWSETNVITTESNNDSTRPAIAVDSLCNIYIVWQEDDNTQINIYEKSWNATTLSWSINMTISSQITGNSYNPKIGVDENYNIHIVWDAASSSLSSGDDHDVFYRMWNETGKYWLFTEVVSINSPDNSSMSSIAVKADGTVHVTWQDLTPLYGSGNDYDIFYRRRDIITGSWSGFDNLTDVVSYGSDQSSLYPSIMVDEYSVVHIVWVDYSNISGAGTDADIFYKFWNSSDFTWQGYFNSTDIVTVESSADSMFASVATNRYNQGTISMKIHVVWQDKTDFGFGSDWDIYYKSFIEIAYFPITPILSPIRPEIDYDGLINLDWTVSGNATEYYVYRDVSNITDVSFLTPIAVVTGTNYTDILSVDGTYYYVIVSGNNRFNSSHSNCENVTLIKYYPVSIPILDPISPSLDYDGVITLNWSGAENATIYYIYRDTSPITDISSLSPIDTTVDFYYQDTISIDDTYYFVIVASNLGYNSSISNCENVSVEIYYPVATPLLSPILPDPDYDGIINLEWGDLANATFYYVYRDTTFISNISGLVPTANITQSNYTDIVLNNDTYYYIIIGGNKAYNSSISNCENVTVEIYPIPETPYLEDIIPTTNYYGNVKLNWTDTANTSLYYIYRSTTFITDITGLTPIITVADSNYTDYIFVDGIYYYAIVATNIGRNGSVSNIQNVTIELYYPVDVPILHPIEPNVDYDGIIEIDWDNTENATKYYIFRNSAFLGVATQSNYTDMIFIDGNYTYTILAGNPGYNSSLSNPENVSVIKYWPVGTSILTLITPQIDYDGQLVYLNWTSAENASFYYLYRDITPITTITNLNPIDIVFGLEYLDNLSVDDTYYYCIVASNLGYNGSLSNVVNVTVFIQYPINTPVLNPISPTTDTDGKINLDWPDEPNALWYYVYKYYSPINTSNIVNLEPITTVAASDYTDTHYINGTIYYCIVGGNWLYNSTISSPESVKIALPATLNDWGSLEVLSYFSSADSIMPTIASDSLGNLHVVFEDTMSPDRDIVYIHWNNLTRVWMNYEIVSSESDKNSTSPIIYVDNLNNVHIIWIDYSNISGSGDDSDIFYKYLNVTTGLWGQTVVISSKSSRDSYAPTICGDNRGNLYVAWYEFDGNQNNIYFKMYDRFTDTWISNQSVSEPISGFSYDPIISVDKYSNVYLAWSANSTYGGSGSDYDIFYRSLNNETRLWGSVELISTQSVQDSIQPDIMVDFYGNIYLTWADKTNYASAGSDFDIFFKFRNITSSQWAGFLYPVDIVSNESTSDSLNPSIKIDSSYNVHIAWEDYTELYGCGNDADIFYKLFNKTLNNWHGKINKTDIVSSESTQDSLYPSILIADNNIHIIWQDISNFGFGSDWDVLHKKLQIPTPSGEPDGPGGPDGQDFWIWIIIIIIIIGAAVGTTVAVVGFRGKKTPSSEIFVSKEIKTKIIEAGTVEDKIQVLEQNSFPVNSIFDLNDKDLNSYFNQDFATMPVELLEFVQKLDAPLDNKIEIIEEFNNLSEEKKEQFLKELTEL
jgi:parallel beta-helix repeat protein